MYALVYALLSQVYAIVYAITVKTAHFMLSNVRPLKTVQAVTSLFSEHYSLNQLFSRVSYQPSIAACAADVLYCHSIICIHQGKQMVNMNQL